jgi:alpha/beta superfamily hydrolase
MKPQHIIFPCGELKLEGLYYGLEAEGPVPGVAVCHPHPLYGGSMHNNVTYAVAEALVKAGIAALLFNFRGVGRSEGRHGGGIAEQQDISAGLDWLLEQKHVVKTRLGLAGYSFGGGVALPVACADGRVRCFALISPYFEESPISLLKGCRKPKLIMGGGRDDMVPPADVEQYGEEAAEPKTYEIIKGADHFWGGYEGQMADKVAGFFQSSLRTK